MRTDEEWLRDGVNECYLVETLNLNGKEWTILMCFAPRWPIGDPPPVALGGPKSWFFPLATDMTHLCGLEVRHNRAVEPDTALRTYTLGLGLCL